MGNGISLLIFAGIVARIPINIFQTFSGYSPSQIPSYIAFFVLSIVIIAGVVLITEARRNIPVSYAKRVRGMKMYGGTSTYFYWIVASYSLGKLSPAGPFIAANAAGTLSSSNYTQISLSYPLGISSVDVLRTNSAIVPGGACNCAVATGLSVTSASEPSNTTRMGRSRSVRG